MMKHPAVLVSGCVARQAAHLLLWGLVLALASPAQAWVMGTTNYLFTAGGTFFSSAAIGTNGTIYVGTKDHNAPFFYAFGPDGTTQHVWRLVGRTYAPPAIGPDGTIYVGCESNMVYALNPDGTTQRTWSTSTRITCAPAIARDGTIYVAGYYDGCLYSFNPDGRTNGIWEVSSDYIVSSPVLTSNDQVLVLNDAGDLLLISSLGTTQAAWNAGTGTYSTPAIGADGTIYVPSLDKNLYAFNPDGTTQRTWTASKSFDYSSVAIGTNGVLYVGDTGGFLYGFDVNGATQHAWRADGAIYSSPALGADGTIYVASNYGTNYPSVDPNFYAFNANGTTAIVWRLDNGDGNARVQASPAIGLDGTVYIGSYDQAAFFALPGTGGKLMNSPWPKYGQNMFNSSALLRAPTNTTASQWDYDDRVALAWSSCPYALGYEIWRSTIPAATGAVCVGSTTGLSFSDTSALALREYYYWARATNTVFRSPFEGSGAMGERSCYVLPDNGPWNGGNFIVLTNGLMGNGSDITNVSFAGFPAASITGQGLNWVRVRVPAGPTGLVEVAIYSTSRGATTIPGAYLYNGQGAIGVDIEDYWTEVAGMPGDRKFVAGGVLDGYLYAVAGEDASANRTNVYRFDGSAWTEVVGLPDIRTRMGVAAFSNRLHAVAGYRTSVAVTNVFVFDGASWTQTAGLPAARHSPAVAVFNGHLYAMGGQLAAGAETNVYRFNGTSWTEVPGLPARRYGAAAVAWQDNLYVMGGYDATGTAASNVYKSAGASWTEVAGLPAAQAYPGADEVAGLVTVMGGTTSSNVCRFDSTNWVAGAVMPAHRYAFAGGVLDGYYYAAGGAGPAGTPRANTYKYQGRVFASGVEPASGPTAGGFPVTIWGSNLCSGEMADVLDVRLCNIPATINAVSATQIQVTASAAPAALVGDVKVVSTAFGITTVSDRFSYTQSGIMILGTNRVPIVNGAAANTARGTDFGLWVAGTSRVHTLTITNDGSSPLTIGGWTTNGSSASLFTVSGIPATVPAGGATGFTVRFASSAAGAFTAAVVIASDASGADASFRINLRGSAYSLSAWRGPDYGGNSVTITNGRLGAGADITNVLAGGLSAVIVSQGVEWVRVVMPGSVPGVADLVVQSISRGASVLPAAYTFDPHIQTVAAPHGSITPAGVVVIPYGGSTSFVVDANTYYHIDTVETNGVAVAGVHGLARYTSRWNNVTATGLVVGIFAENVTSNTSTPEWWLARYGWSSGFEAAATNDADNDSVFTWQEYIADTIPTNGRSYLHFSDHRVGLVEWVGGTAVVQYLESTLNLVGTNWTVLATNRPVTPVTNTCPVSATATMMYFRVRAVR